MGDIFALLEKEMEDMDACFKYYISVKGSKYAVIGITKSVAVDNAAPHNVIRCHAVCSVSIIAAEVDDFLDLSKRIQRDTDDTASRKRKQAICN